MKGMAELQEQVVRQCARERMRTGSDYPRPIVLFPGIVARVDSAEEERRARKREAWLVGLFGAGLGAITAIGVVAILWDLWVSAWG